MSFIKCPKYTAALETAVIQFGKSGEYNAHEPHKTSEEVLLRIWVVAIAATMGPREATRFKGIPLWEKKIYFDQKSFFCFDHFSADFLANAHRARFMVVE